MLQIGFSSVLGSTWLPTHGCLSGSQHVWISLSALGPLALSLGTSSGLDSDSLWSRQLRVNTCPVEITLQHWLIVRPPDPLQSSEEGRW